MRSDDRVFAIVPGNVATAEGTIMAGKTVPDMQGVRVYPTPPADFDALTASDKDLVRHGLPRRPDPHKQPELAALWDQRARRYKGFEHIAPVFQPAANPPEIVAAGFGLFPLESCGFELFDASSPITVFTGTWNVPHLNHSPTAGPPNNIRTFFGLGFLDLHVEMTVDTSQNITIVVRIHTGAQLAIPVSSGDTISATLCLQTNSAGTAFYGVVNETTSQVVNFTIDTGFPPAVAINAGVSRGSAFNGPPDPLARFGVVYFDELVAYTPSGTRQLTNGVATTMVDSAGKSLAFPQTLNNRAFKVVFQSS